MIGGHNRASGRGAAHVLRAVLLLVLGGVWFGLGPQLNPARADDFVLLQSTTSTENSGFYRHLLPIFTARTGIDVRVVAVGTGQALRNGRNGDGDVVLVHAKPAEEAFVADGYGLFRADLMYNDYVLVGPPDDPAKVARHVRITDAFAAIARHAAPFVSRGDDSGTHQKERELWQETGVDPRPASGNWYRETGSGMGATLNTGIAMGAYMLTDRATWLSFGNRGTHRILLEGDPRLFNQYGVIAVNPERHPRVRAHKARIFVDWLLSDEGQAAIGAFEIDGQQVFVPNATMHATPRVLGTQ